MKGEKEKTQQALPGPLPSTASMKQVSSQQSSLVTLQRMAGNQAVTRLLSNPPVAVSRRDALWHSLDTFVQQGDYADAAATLNEFSNSDISLVLRQLHPSHLEKLRDAALGAKAGWSARVVLSIDHRVTEIQEAERVRRLEESFDIAVLMGQWKDAAIYLNGFNDYDIVRKLRPLGDAKIKEIAAAAPSGYFRVARIGLAMLQETVSAKSAVSSSAAQTSPLVQVTTIVGAGLPLISGQGPLRTPGLSIEPMKSPGFGPESFRTPFVEPPPTVQIPMKTPGLGTGAPAIDPLPAGATAEIRLASAVGRILVVSAEVAQAAAIPLTLGAMGISDTNLEENTRQLRVSTVERMRKIVDDVNRRLTDALRVPDLKLIRDKSPGLFDAALQRSTDDIVLAIRLLKLAYGIAVEKYVADAVASDPFLNSVLDYVAGPNRADFYGKGFMRGLNFDVTTRRDRDRHTDPNLRPRYGENLITITYHPPWAEEGW
jgi:hypothetical protein